ncbi:MAG: RagB/SusD family nutrient uptake outer membrane protein [Alistipes sp.]|nr:RagB/SusD family nutrient uptake outer membrane protein [Alistipes sp.]MBR0339575.1 RagB/SusD family nutrient uptake outer membrane protein [Alistipes sp.]
MKKILVLILSVATLVGCTLEEKVISASEPNTYYQTVPQCKTGLNGCYIPLKDLYRNADYFETCEVAADLIYHNTDSYYDAMCRYSQSEPRFGNTIWTQSYRGVMRCNAMYASIERSPLSEEEKAPLLAECEILRAFYYYILTINFGDVPYYWDEVTDANNDKIAQLPRMSADDLRAQLMQNLEYWLIEKQALPYIKTYAPENEYRIGAMVGFVLAGKLALWNKDWDKAIEYFSYIEQVYGCADSEGGYTPAQSLLGYSLKDVMFRNRYTAESIFELPAYAKDYGLRVTHGLASRCTPSRSSTQVEGGDVGDGGDDVEMEDDTVDLSKKDDMYNGIRIPSLGAEARTTSPYRPTWYMYKTLMPYNSKDKRRSVYDANKWSSDEIVEVEGGGGWLAWCYVGWTQDENMDTVPAHMIFFNDTKKKGEKSGQPFLGDKFWCPGMVYNQDSNNLKIFRFAHVVLDLAEAYMRMGDWDKANGYLNATRQRAGLDPLTLYSEEEFMEELQKESARELFGEFTRRHNLVRWGIWYDQVVNHACYPNSSGTTKYNCDIYTHVQPYPCREYYPIPDQQIVLSNYNLSNPEYEKYGL